jgi:hypothetical protein
MTHRYTVIFEKEEGAATTSFALPGPAATPRARRLRRASEISRKRLSFISRAWSRTDCRFRKKIF